MTEKNSNKNAENSEGRIALRFWFHLVRTSRLIEARANQRMRKTYGQSMARFDVLAQLVHFDEDWVPTGRLAGKLIAAGSNATGLLDRMVSEGLVARRPSQIDRRSFEINITEKGRELLSDMDENHSQWIADMLKDIPDGDLARMAENFIKIRHVFDETGSKET